MKLIKLTSHKNDEPIYINIDKIDFFYERKAGEKYYEGKPIIERHTRVGHSGSFCLVKETPEEIIVKIKMIKNSNSTRTI